MVGVGVTVALLSSLIRPLAPRYVPYIVLGGGVFLCLSLLPSVRVLVSEMRALGEHAGGEYVSVLLRAMGVGYVVQTGASVCRDVGETTLAERLELCGKTEILVMTVPYLVELISMAEKLLSGA